MPVLPEFAEEELMAFIRELDPERMARIRQAMRISPSLRSQIEDLRRFYEARSEQDQEQVQVPPENNSRSEGTRSAPPQPQRSNGRKWMMGILLAAAAALALWLWSHPERPKLQITTSSFVVTKDSAASSSPGESAAADLTALPEESPRALAVPNRKPNHVVLLVDASGSMQMAWKLPLVQEAFLAATRELLPADLLSIVVYAGAKGVLLPPTPLRNIHRVRDAFTRMVSGGLHEVPGQASTKRGIHLAMELAEEKRDEVERTRIVLITDGDFNFGENSEDATLRTIETIADSGTTLSVLGFAKDEQSEETMRTFAEWGRGLYSSGDTTNVIREFFKQNYDAVAQKRY